MIHSISFSNKQSSDKDTKSSGSGLGKALAINTGLALLGGVSLAAYRGYKDKKSKEREEFILNNRNSEINALTDNYLKDQTLPSIVTPEISKRYNVALAKIVNDNIRLYKPHHNDTIYETKILPFTEALQYVLIKGMHIIAGNAIGVDRRNFELCYDTTKTNPNDVLRDPFRTVVFRFSWPVHGYKMVNAQVNRDADNLIAATLKFLSNNPKFLSIRV